MPLKLLWCFLGSAVSVSIPLSFYLFRRHKRLQEFKQDLFFRLLGSHFYFLYVLHSIFSKVSEHPRWNAVSWLNFAAVQSLFVFFGMSYLIRGASVSRASRPREVILPLLCAVLPFGILKSPHWVDAASVVLGRWAPIVLTPFYSLNRNLIVSVVILLGHLFCVCSIYSLKSSFSILTEARRPVFRGLYRWIRHPLYVGEIVATFGFCLYQLSWFNLFLMGLFILLLNFRATFEEEKIAACFPEYENYRKTTGKFWPVVL